MGKVEDIPMWHLATVVMAVGKVDAMPVHQVATMEMAMVIAVLMGATAMAIVWAMAVKMVVTMVMRMVVAATAALEGAMANQKEVAVAVMGCGRRNRPYICNDRN